MFIVTARRIAHWESNPAVIWALRSDPLLVAPARSGALCHVGRHRTSTPHLFKFHYEQEITLICRLRVAIDDGVEAGSNVKPCGAAFNEDESPPSIPGAIGRPVTPGRRSPSNSCLQPSRSPKSSGMHVLLHKLHDGVAAVHDLSSLMTMGILFARPERTAPPTYPRQPTAPSTTTCSAEWYGRDSRDDRHRSNSADLSFP